MAINLRDHKVFVESLQMDMVPLSVAEKAVEDAFNGVEEKVEEAMSLIHQSLKQLGSNLTELDDQDSTREP